jgi:erythromycin esterase-like protein
MSPGELHGLADRKLAESRSLGDDAARLRVEVAGLPDLLEPLIAMSRSVWRGPAADEFELNVAQHSRILSEQSTQIVRLAAELEERATRLRREAASLRDQAVAAEAAALLPVAPGGVA